VKYTCSLPISLYVTSLRLSSLAFVHPSSMKCLIKYSYRFSFTEFIALEAYSSYRDHERRFTRHHIQLLIGFTDLLDSRYREYRGSRLFLS
jgi:hypothetical protein